MPGYAKLCYRVWIGVLGLLFSLTVSAVTDDRVRAEAHDWQFDVYLDDRLVGKHRFSLQSDGDRMRVLSRASFQVSWLFLTAYDYHHEAEEHWHDDCVVSLTALTNDNGEMINVQAFTEDNSLIVQSPNKRQSIDGCVMTFAYWNPGILARSQLLNSQTGQYESVRIEFMGTESISGATGTVSAEHYRLRANSVVIDLWYEADSRRWLKLNSILDNGHEIRYEPQRKARSAQPQRQASR